jgi:hypothetical protein
MACMGWAVQGHAAPWWTRPGESIHSQKPNKQVPSCTQAPRSMALREVVEATLHGRDERMVVKCNVPAILGVFERWDIYELDTLASTLTASFAELQADMEAVAARSFLGLLKSTLGKSVRSVPPETPSSAPPQSPFTETPPFFSPPLHPPPPPTVVPIVVTIKMNGKLVGERSTLSVPPTATWEAVARTRLDAVASVEEVSSYLSMPLAVSLFPDAEHSMADRVGAAISDTVAAAAALGYHHVVLTLSPPIYGCARPAARGVDAPARMMDDARKQAACVGLPKPYAPKVRV